MAWLTPTRRVVRWSPLLVAFGLAVGTLAMLRLTDRPLRGLELTIASTTVARGGSPTGALAHDGAVTSNPAAIHNAVFNFMFGAPFQFK